MEDRLREPATRTLNAIWYGGNPLAWLLWPLQLVFRGLVAVRRTAYGRRWFESVDLGVPVIVIGNLTVGGTGKTPLTIWLADRLGARGLRVGIICSGYGGAAETWPQTVTEASTAAVVGDEARLLFKRTGGPVVAGRDRVAAGRMLQDLGPVDVVLCDDGLQHYRLRRTIELAVVDGTRGLGNGLCLPAGPLREPASRLATVDAIVVNEGSYGHAGVLRTALEAIAVVELRTGARTALAGFANLSVHAVAAIGNPARFFDLLERAGLDVEPHPHADHAALTVDDITFTDDAPVLITEKDAVKCEHLDVANVFSVVTELKFAPGDEERLLGILLRLLESGVNNQ
jgi:tetraacyldisaccharide 4'-kinase